MNSVPPVCHVPVTFTMLTSDFVPTERHSIYTRAIMALDLKRGLKV